MFTSSLATLSFASIFSILPALEPSTIDIESGSSIIRHNSPAIAGLWELDTKFIVNTVTTQSIDQSASEYVDSHVEPLSQVQQSAGLTISETVLIQGAKPLPIVNPKPNVNSDASVTTVFNASKCRERYNFAADTSMWTVSGAEWSSGEYVVQPISEDGDSLPLLVMKTIYDNNQPDCANSQVDQSGDVLAVYLKYSPEQERMSWCKDARGEQCIMHFRRILP